MNNTQMSGTNNNYYVIDGIKHALPIPCKPFLPAEKDTCFHYTTLNGFKAIVENKTLRFGSYRGFNDADDGFFGVDLVNYWIDTNRHKTSNLYTVNNISKAIVDELYGFSASLLPDDAAQWDRYGDVGNGVCIELEIPQFQTQSQDNSCSQTQSMVLYGENTLIQYLDFVLMRGWNTKTASWDKELALIAAKCKKEGWKQECEIRRITNPDKKYTEYDLLSGKKYIDYIFDGKVYRPLKDEGQESPNGKIIKSNFIKSVTLGPRISTPLHQQIFTKFLQDNDYSNIKVMQSELRFR